MHTETVMNRYFRAGVGSVIYRDNGQLAWFKRAKYPVGIWQFQQGGIDLSETVEAAMWRELREEVGLTAADIKLVTLFPNWTIYQDDVSLTDTSKNRLGQAHRWFFLHLRADKEIDLSQAADVEFNDYTWIEFPVAIAATTPSKQHVYAQLADYFNTTLRPTIEN